MLEDLHGGEAGGQFVMPVLDGPARLVEPDGESEKQLMLDEPLAGQQLAHSLASQSFRDRDRDDFPRCARACDMVVYQIAAYGHRRGGQREQNDYEEHQLRKQAQARPFSPGAICFIGL